MRPWVSRPLLFALPAISRRWGGGGPGGGSRQSGGSRASADGVPTRSSSASENGHGTLQDQPILADFLAVGGAFEANPEEVASASASVRSLSAQKVATAGAQWGPQRSPVSEGGGTRGRSPSPSQLDSEQPARERRLVAAALQPATVLHQGPAPGSPSRLPLDAGSLRWRPRPLPALLAPGGRAAVAVPGLNQAAVGSQQHQQPHHQPQQHHQQQQPAADAGADGSQQQQQQSQGEELPVSQAANFSTQADQSSTTADKFRQPGTAYDEGKGFFPEKPAVDQASRASELAREIDDNG
ncbi:unnamed protein product [Polarella glacialis]|uniref:Uncharacterized protein n=1 Tax=Polarella glacialis TaxID=89957 RepID=A0A813DFG2_POLGL|nr:unnamed protein product [Polarella glacialis]